MAITRQVIFGIDPELGLAETLSYSEVPDNNVSAKTFTSAFVPVTRGAGVTLLQESLFLGGSSEAGVMFQTLKDNLAQDGTTNIVSTFVTARIDPESRPEIRAPREANTKRYHSLQVNGVNPLAKGVTLSWTKDVDPIRGPTVLWKDFNGDGSKTVLMFESGLAEWVHLRGVHSAATSNEIHLDNFQIGYYPVGEGRQGGDS